MGFHLGCAIWGHRGWVGDLFPAGSRQSDLLSLYSRRFPCVEGNTTFYATPRPEILERWVGQTPEGFRICPKLPKVITHEGPLADTTADALRFAAHMAEGLGARLGPFFLQLPPSYGPQMGPDLAAMLNAWRRAVGGHLAVEVRHPAWFREPAGSRLNTLLDRLGMARVMLDTRPVYEGLDDPQEASTRRKPRLPLDPRTTGGAAFVRLITHPDRERNRPYLEEWAERVHGWLDAGVDVWFFVHCPVEDHSPGAARLFQSLLEARGAPVPRLAWDDLPPEPSQIGLFGA